MESFENFIVIGPLLNDLQCDIGEHKSLQLELHGYTIKGWRSRGQYAL